MSDAPPPPPPPGWQPPADGPQDVPPPPGPDPWGSHGWQVQPSPPQSGTDGFAIAAIVLGLLPVCAGVLGVVFGFVSLNRIKQSRQGGRGLAITGIVAGFVWIAVVVTAVVLGAFDDAERDSRGNLTGAGSVGATDLRVGDCVSELPSGTVFNVDVTPCSGSHLGEVYHVFTLPDGDFPGASKVTGSVTKACAQAIHQYVGIAEDDPGYGIYYVAPLERSWRLDRTATCILANDDESPLLGSRRDLGYAHGASPTPKPDLPPGQITGTLGLEDIEIGNCVKALPEGSVNTVDVTPCATPHAAEVFDVYDMPAGAYPGDTKVGSLVLGHCRKVMPGFVGAPAGKTGYSITYYSPTAATWADGDRRAYCLLDDTDGQPLTREAKGKGRHV